MNDTSLTYYIQIIMWNNMLVSTSNNKNTFFGCVGMPLERACKLRRPLCVFHDRRTCLSLPWPCKHAVPHPNRVDVFTISLTSSVTIEEIVFSQRGHTYDAVSMSSTAIPVQIRWQNMPQVSHPTQWPSNSPKPSTWINLLHQHVGSMHVGHV